MEFSLHMSVILCFIHMTLIIESAVYMKRKDEDNCNFKKYTGHLLHDHNNITIPLITPEGCKDRCLHQPKWECLSFDFDSYHNMCHLSSSNRRTKPSHFGKHGMFDYYEKVCGDSEKIEITKDQDIQYQCPDKYMRCRDNTFCIYPEWICDGEIDCGAGSDELNCGRGKCAFSEFQCSPTGPCIPSQWVCDGMNDCSNGADEGGCATPSIPGNGCSAGEFQCEVSKMCIPYQWVCRNIS